MQNENNTSLGSLSIVATPIGNLQDITLRAIDTLKTVNFIVCEDTRVTGRLLQEFHIETRMVSMNDANEESKTYEIIERILTGENAALVSDAGTPLISDPGFKLVRTALQKGIQVLAIPGASAVTSALSVSGLPTDKFLFVGFPPDSLEKKKKFFLNIKLSLEALTANKLTPTVVFFESPHKLFRSFDALEEVFGDIEITVSREITKIYEELRREKISEARAHFTENTPKGEFVLLFRI